MDIKYFQVVPAAIMEHAAVFSNVYISVGNLFVFDDCIVFPSCE